MRPIGANAALRPFHTSARSCSDCATRISHAPFLRQIALHLAHQRLDFARRPVQLHQQQPVAHRIVRMHRGLGRLDRQRVHDLQRRRQHAGRNDVADGLARGL